MSTAGRLLAAALAACAIASMPAPVGAATAERGWGSPVAVPFAGEVGDVDLASPVAGEVVAVWTEAPPGRFATIKSVAMRRGAAPAAPTTLGERAFWPTVASTRSGEAIAAWEHEPVEGEFQRRQRILVSVRPPGGGFGAPVDVGQGQGGIALAANGRGDAVVLFVRYGGRDAAGEIVETRRLFAAFRPAGGRFEREQPVTGVIAQNHITGAHDVVLAPSGAGLFVWEEPVGSGTVVRAAVRTPSGGLLPAQTLSDPARDAVAPKVAVDGHGNAIATWIESDPDGRAPALRAGEVKVALAPGFGDRAAPFGAPQGLGDLAWGVQGPEVAASRAGEAVVAYASVAALGAAGQQVGPARVAFADLAGGRIAAPVTVPGSSGGWRVGLALNAAGDAAVAFDDFQTGEMRVARRTAGTAFGPARTVGCPPPGSPLPETVAVDPAGGAAVGWLRFDRQGLLVSGDAPADAAPPVSCETSAGTSGGRAARASVSDVRLRSVRRLTARAACAGSCSVALRGVVEIARGRIIRVATARPVSVVGRWAVVLRLRRRDGATIRRALRNRRRVAARMQISSVDASGRRSTAVRMLRVRRGG